MNQQEQWHVHKAIQNVKTGTEKNPLEILDSPARRIKELEALILEWYVKSRDQEYALHMNIQVDRMGDVTNKTK